jgi:hypothetical protein
LAGLKPSGSAAKLVPLLNDQDEGVRLATLKPLLTGHYTATFNIWEPIVNAEHFTERDAAEKRNIFHAMRVTTGDDAVPYWGGLLTDWGWTNRKKPWANWERPPQRPPWIRAQKKGPQQSSKPAPPLSPAPTNSYERREAIET